MHAERVDSVVQQVLSARVARRGPRRGGRLGPLASAAFADRLVRVGWIAAVLVLALAAVAFGHAHRGPFPPLALVLAVAATAPLLVLRRWPLAALSLIVVADATFIVWARLPWPPTAVLAWLLGLAACPLLLRRRLAVVLLVITEIAVLAAVLVPTSLNPRPWDAPITEALAVLLAWGGAEALRSRRQADRQQVVMDEQLRSLQEREAAARGRAEIARELHDVVAHHVSLIAVRAATAPYQLNDVSEATSAAFTEIAAEARAALDDLRAVLGVLRTADGQVSHAPQPCLADVAPMLQRLRSNGMSVTFTHHGEPRPLGAAVQLCCYRVIQEALTNAARHAPGAPVAVTIDYREIDIAVRITNQHPGGHSIGQATSGAGFGLLGMRERVAALDGELTTADRADGFLIEARIPAPTPRRQP